MGLHGTRAGVTVGRGRGAGRLSAAEEAQLGMRRGRSAYAAPPLPSDSLPLETRRRRDAARAPGDGSTDPQTGSGGGATGSAELSCFSDPGAARAQVRPAGVACVCQLPRFANWQSSVRQRRMMSATC